MDEESRQKRILILLASAVCAVLIGYNAFYVPDATAVWTGSPSSAAERAASLSSDEAYTPESVPASSNMVSKPRKTPAVSGKSGKVNINTASAEELSSRLSGVGPALSGRIVSYRKKNGPFRSTEEIKNVSGIGDKIYAKIRDSITVK